MMGAVTAGLRSTHASDPRHRHAAGLGDPLDGVDDGLVLVAEVCPSVVAYAERVNTHIERKKTKLFFFFFFVWIKRTAKAAAYIEDERGRPGWFASSVQRYLQPGPREQEFRFGFFETNVGQLGPMWRSAGWMATSVGAFETGKDINTFRVSWETQGIVDGPSAGGLMTSAIVAGFLGR